MCRKTGETLFPRPGGGVGTESVDNVIRSPKQARKRSNNTYGGKTVSAGTAPYIDKNGKGLKISNMLAGVTDQGSFVQTPVGNVRRSWRRRLADAEEDRFFLASGLDAECTTQIESYDLNQIGCCALKISAPDAGERWYLSATVNT